MRHGRFIVLSIAMLSACRARPPARDAARGGQASHTAPTSEAAPSVESTGRAYLEMVDSGDFAHAWLVACDARSCGVDEPAFARDMTRTQATLGKLLSRAFESARPSARPAAGVDRQALTLTYRAHFEKMSDAIETLDIVEDPQGAWHPVGYDVRPAPCIASSVAATSSLRRPPASLALDAFYAKYVDADGLPVVGSAQVSDRALLAARVIVRRMLRKRPDLRDRLRAAGLRVTVMSPTEQTLDIPEQAELAQSPTDTPGIDWNQRARGLGGSFDIPVASCSEENLLCMPCDRYQGENILVHEFGHTIETMGLAADVSFQRDLREAYDAALTKGLWRGTYAASNVHEYWAEGVQDWFDANLHDVHEHNEIHTRAQLRTYDPALYALLGRVFEDDEWRYECSASPEPSGGDIAVLPHPREASRPRLRCPAGMAFVDGGRLRPEAPVQPLCMDRSEVTVAAYASCARARACSPAFTTVRTSGNTPAQEAEWSLACNGDRSDRQDHPVNCVDWSQAETYCRAQGKRLPTEQEWEWAARGGDRAWGYPWGNGRPAAKACWSAGGTRASTCPVGSFPDGDTPGGIHDLAGNVWEWTAGTGDEGSRVQKGGGWPATAASALRVTARLTDDPTHRFQTVGFRCVR